MKIDLKVTNETATLKKVILGIGEDRGKVHGINPLIRKHIKENTLPKDVDIQREIKSFETVLTQANVEVLRPTTLAETEQIFTRDIGFVIDDLFFVANMKHPSRRKEFAGIAHHIDNLVKEGKRIKIPEGAIVEGGDVILFNEHIFIGVGERTNWAGVEFIKQQLPNKKVHGLELKVDEVNPEEHALHLDCIFQPIGKSEAIIYEAGFKNKPEDILNVFSDEQLIKVTKDQKNQMFPNIFSISPTEVIIEKSFTALKTELEKRNYTVYEVDYTETSKFNGLLRCSTLPLLREN